jgi:hypothetical protein
VSVLFFEVHCRRSDGPIPHPRNADEYVTNELYKRVVRFQVLTAASMKNTVFWDVEISQTNSSRAAYPSF